MIRPQYLSVNTIFDTDASLFPSVAGPSNVNLTPGQLLLWHRRLGISMSRIQELMVPHQAKDENGLQDVMPCLITPAFKTAATCPIPCCVACELACACPHPTGATKQLAVEEKSEILSANQYQVEDLVSMDQFVSGTPGWLFSGYGREAQHNWFHGGTIFNDAASEPFRLNIKSLLMQVKPSVQRSNLKSGCMNSAAWRLHGTTVIMVSLLLLNSKSTARWKGWMLGRLLIDLLVQRSLTLFGPSTLSNFQMD
jgi:hypothetical protein